MHEVATTAAYDVLVLGAGGAGLRAALAASDAGARVAVISKSLLGKSQTVMGAALAAALGTASGPRDSWAEHYADTVRGGRHVNQWRMVQLLAEEAPARVREMETWGALFDRAADGDIRQTEGSGHRNARLARAGHRTGLELLRAMQSEINQRGIDLYCEYTVVELLKDGERIAGACARRRDTGATVVFPASAVVLATGGIGKIYAFTSNFYDSTGDGHALAYRAGAELIDMEFVQFHPTGMVAPESARGLLVAESIRNFGGILRNRDGERFMFHHVPPGYRAEIADSEAEADAWYNDPLNKRRPPELLPRDEVSRAIESEIRAGHGTPNGGVLLDIASRRPAEYIRRTLPHMVSQFRDLADVDITAEPMEVAPTCHYMMGGVRVDPDTCAGSVPGLFAAGEAAGGLHGANRLNGNGISELLVFGRRAGLHAARHAHENPTPVISDPMQIERVMQGARASLLRSSGENPFTLQREVQALMQSSVALVRTETGLERALMQIRELAERAQRMAAPGGDAANPAWQCALDVRSLLTVAEAVTRSALLRRESRGAHVRDDYREDDPALAAVNVVTRLTDRGMQVRTETRLPAPAALSKLTEETAA